MSIVFLTLGDVLEIHKNQIKRYGGSCGIRDEHLLLSSIAQPYATFGGKFLHKTVHDKASAYLFHICQNHPFIDGNKRASLASALTFLFINSYSIEYDEKTLFELTMLTAQGKLEKEEISLFLEKNIG